MPRRTVNENELCPNRPEEITLVVETGEPGPKGDTGPAGIQGPVGPMGPAGPVPVVPEWTYTNPTPMPFSVGNINAGETFNEVPLSIMWDKLLYPYMSPAFTQFSFPYTSPMEVGFTFPGGNHTFTWTTSNSVNVKPDTIEISDTTTSTVIASGLANDSSHVASLPPVTNTVATSHTWGITGINTRDLQFSRSFSLNWQWAVYFGENVLGALTEGQIESLRAKQLMANSAATYDFIAYPMGYKYIAYPTLFGLKTTFINPANGFAFAMEPATVVSVTNDYGITTDYYVHRSTNTLSGAISCQVS